MGNYLFRYIYQFSIRDFYTKFNPNVINVKLGCSFYQSVSVSVTPSRLNRLTNL